MYGKSMFYSIAVGVFSTLVLSACGGGGGGSSSSSSSTTAAPSSVTTPVTSVVAKSGTVSIVDASAIEGLRVECGSEELYTGEEGEVVCDTFPLSVYLGEFKLGEVETLPLDNSLYTQDLLGVSRGATAYPEVTKISMLVQSLDEDANPLNGITLADDTLALLGSHLSYTTILSELSFDDISYIVEDVIATRLTQNENSKLKAVDYNTAQSNLTTKTAAAPALSYTQRAAGRSL